MSSKQFCINGHDTFMVGRTAKSTCRQCQRVATKEYMARYRAEHRDIMAERSRQWRRNNPDKVKAHGREAKWRSWGLDFTEDDYQAMFQKQDGRCLNCGKTSEEAGDKQRLGVDHDHRTLEIRGLLCSRCNLQDVLAGT